MRDKVLIFGANFPLATRISDLIGREFDVIRYDFLSAYHSNRIELATIFTGDQLSEAVSHQCARHVILTSESLLYMHSEEQLSGLVTELKAYNRSPEVHLTYVEVAEPVIVESAEVIRRVKGDSIYSKRLAILGEALRTMPTLVLRVQSIYTAEDDAWNQNFLRLILSGTKGAEPICVDESDSHCDMLSADEVAESIVTNFGKVGILQLSNGPYPGGLGGFCEDTKAEFEYWLRKPAMQQSGVGRSESAPLPRQKETTPSRLAIVTHQAHCAVNYLYRKSPENEFASRTVAQFRYDLGKVLAYSIPREVVADIDMVVPVPETGKIYARGLAESLRLPYVEAIHKTGRKRSFDIESFDDRRDFLFSRLAVSPTSVANKSMLVVDEAIFTGATLKVVSHLLWEAGAKSIYFAIPSPEARYQCIFNMLPKRSLLAEYVRKEDLWSYFNVQAVYFQDEETFAQSIGIDGPNCMACFIKKSEND